MNTFDYGLRCYLVLFVVRELDLTTTIRFAYRTLHGARHAVGIENDASVDIPRRATDGLDE